MTHSLRLLLLNIILNCISKLNYFRLPQQCGFRPQARWTVSSWVQCSAYIPTHPIPAPTQSLLWCPLRFGSSVQLCIGMFHLVSPIFHISPAFENDCSYSPDLMPVSSSQRHFQCLLSFSGLPLFISPPTSPAPPRSFFLLSQQPFNTFKVIFNAMFIILIVLQWINQGTQCIILQEMDFFWSLSFQLWVFISLTSFSDFLVDTAAAMSPCSKLPSAQ